MPAHANSPRWRVSGAVSYVIRRVQWEQLAAHDMNRLHTQDRRPRICFVAHAAYGALTGGNSGHIGGVERQTTLMARWFAGRGYRVSVVTWDEGQEGGTEIDGVQVFKMCSQSDGIRGLRFLWPRWTSLVAAMRRANADVYYQNCGECITGEVALWCRKHDRTFIYSVASDPDCDVRLPEMHRLRDRLLYRYGLTHADKVIVQTHRQQAMLRTGCRLDATVIPMPCPGPSAEEYADSERTRHGAGRVLWMGRVCHVKRPDRLLDLAELCPELSFDLVGPQDGSEYCRGVCERARTITNVAVHGAAPWGRVGEFYRRAGVLCCTSDFEGFPNTFLEAWSHGLPVVSMFDPDDLIAGKGLGKVGEDVPELASGIREMLGSAERWREASRAARQYYLENHALDAAMTRFERAFCEVYHTSGRRRVGDAG
jgi:glycosyltransferase involved in cell wall biosynthesis